MRRALVVEWLGKIERWCAWVAKERIELYRGNDNFYTLMSGCCLIALWSWVFVKHSTWYNHYHPRLLETFNNFPTSHVLSFNEMHDFAVNNNVESLQLFPWILKIYKHSAWRDFKKLCIFHHHTSRLCALMHRPDNDMGFGLNKNLYIFALHLWQK